MKLSEKEYFNKISDGFDTKFNAYGQPAGNLRVQRRIALFAKHCNLRQGLKILEIGCGTGQYSQALVNCNSVLLATDLSFNMLIKAQMKLKKEKNIIFFVSDIEHLPILNNSCDVVLGNSVLHHLEIERALKEIFRVMKPGARFAFSEPNMLNPYVFLQKRIKFIKKLSGDSPKETAFWRWDIKQKFKNAGFRKVIVQPFDFLYPYTPACFIRLVDKMGMFLESTPLNEIAGSLLIMGEK